MSFPVFEEPRRTIPNTFSPIAQQAFQGFQEGFNQDILDQVLGNIQTGSDPLSEILKSSLPSNIKDSLLDRYQSQQKLNQETQRFNLDALNKQKIEEARILKEREEGERKNTKQNLEREKFEHEKRQKLKGKDVDEFLGGIGERRQELQNISLGRRQLNDLFREFGADITQPGLRATALQLPIIGPQFEKAADAKLQGAIKPFLSVGRRLFGANVAQTQTALLQSMFPQSGRSLEANEASLEVLNQFVDLLQATLEADDQFIIETGGDFTSADLAAHEQTFKARFEALFDQMEKIKQENEADFKSKGNKQQSQAKAPVSLLEAARRKRK